MQVERERNLYLSKLNEFDNLLKNSYGSQNPSFPQTSQSPMSMNNTSSANVQSNAAPSFSSFSQLTTNLGLNSRYILFWTISSAVVTLYGQFFPLFVAISNFFVKYLYFSPNLLVFLIRTNPPGTPNGTGFVQPSPFQNASQNSVGFGVKFGAAGGVAMAYFFLNLIAHYMIWSCFILKLTFIT